MKKRANTTGETKSRQPSATPRNPEVMTIYGKPGNDPEADIAQAYLRPTVQAGSTVRAFNKGKDGSGPGINALVAELQTQVSLVADGDLRRTEAMLIAQAHSLDAIFGNLARKAIVQEHLLQYEAHMRLALKAQNQCRATLETLATIKNPPIVFAKQANVTTGPQQVNNGLVAPSRARETENLQSKLLEAHDAERLDLATTGTASGTDSNLAPVGEINRPENGKG